MLVTKLTSAKAEEASCLFMKRLEAASTLRGMPRPAVDFMLPVATVHGRFLETRHCPSNAFFSFEAALSAISC